ncbi:hypothetical protein D3C81_1132880 [compost metagenome]
MIVAGNLRPDVTVHLRPFGALGFEYGNGFALVLGEIDATGIGDNAAGNAKVRLRVFTAAACTRREGRHRRVVLHVRSSRIEVVAIGAVTHTGNAVAELVLLAGVSTYGVLQRIVLAIVVRQRRTEVRRMYVVAKRDRNAEKVLRIEVPLLVACTLGADTEAAPTVTIAVTDLVADVTASVRVPVVARDASGEHVATTLAQRLVDVDLEAVALAVRDVTIPTIRAQLGEVGKVEIALAGEAIGSQHEVGLSGLHQLAIGEAVALPAHAAAQVVATSTIPRHVHVRSMRLGHIRG